MKLPLWRQQRDEELEEEIQSHLRMAIRDRMECGESAEEAALAARREFGNIGLIKETARGIWGFGALGTFWQDLRYGARMLLKQPGFALMAILTLALGMGANTAIFSVVNAALLRPPVAAQPEQLFRILKRHGNFFSFPTYRDLAERTQAFSMLGAHSATHLNLRQGDAIGRVYGEFVTGNFFPALGVHAALGSTFGMETDSGPGAHPVAVVSHGLWRRRFGADAQLVGKTIVLNELQFTVIGVMPEGFHGTWPHGLTPELWVPMAMQLQLRPGSDNLNDRHSESVNVFGRLKPGVSPAEVQAEISLVARWLAVTYPALDPEENRNLEGARVYPLGKAPEHIMRLLSVFLGLVSAIAGLVLLLACANVANLLLARAVLRRQEVAIRLALGANRWRLIRQLLTESALLVLAGGTVACLLAAWFTYLLRSFYPPTSIPVELNPTLDTRVLGFTLAVSALSGLLFGLAPAWYATKLDLVPMLKDNRRGGRRARFSFRNLLVVAQVAMSLILLICAGLFTRSLQNVNNVDPGFETEHALTVPLDLGAAGYDEARGRLFYRQLLDQFEQAPSVQQVSLAEIIPLKTEMARGSRVAVEGYDAPGGDYPWLLLNTVGPRYFETMGITVLAGREFNRQDGEGAQLVAIINETMARRFWTGPQSALGRRLRLSEGGNVFSPYYEVVGIVKDSKYRSMSEESRSFFYVPALQHYRQHMALHLRTIGEPGLLRGAVRDRVLALDKGLLVEVATMRENLAASFLLPRVAAVVLGLVGLFGLSLAVVGIYGVISYTVSQRTGEIGLRMALGAQSRDILWLVIGQGLKLTLIGVGVGGIIALALTRFLASLLVGVSAADPLKFLAVPLLLTTVASFACWIPARRATKVDPMVALRFE